MVPIQVQENKTLELQLLAKPKDKTNSIQIPMKLV